MNNPLQCLCLKKEGKNTLRFRRNNFLYVFLNKLVCKALSFVGFKTNFWEFQKC